MGLFGSLALLAGFFRLKEREGGIKEEKEGEERERGREGRRKREKEEGREGGRKRRRNGKKEEGREGSYNCSN